MSVYIVNGLPGSGKTTFETMVSDYQNITSKNYLVKWTYILSTVDFVKQVAEYCGWDKTKDAKNRKFLSDLKDLLTEWDDVPFKKITHNVKILKNEFDNLDLDFSECAVFIDCREPKEIARLKKALDAKTILIKRDNYNPEVSNHADAEVNNYHYDITIHNSGNLCQLAVSAFYFIKSEKLFMPNCNFKVNEDGKIEKDPN